MLALNLLFSREGSRAGFQFECLIGLHIGNYAVVSWVSTVQRCN